MVKIGDTYYMITTRPDLQGVDIYTSTNKTDMEDTRVKPRLSPSAKGWDSARVYYRFLVPCFGNRVVSCSIRGPRFRMIPNGGSDLPGRPRAGHNVSSRGG